MADLSAASLDDVKGFFRTYYAPNNATLAVVGDFDSKKTKELIASYFGPIPAGPTFTRPAIAPVMLAAEKRLVLEDSKAELPQLTIAWPTVGSDNHDNIALNVLGDVLTQDRTSRLTKLLVYQHQLATDVSAGQGSYENGGQFEISVTPRANASLTDIERLVDSTIAAFATNPPTEQEIEHFKNYTRVNTILGLDGALNKAEVLLDGETFHHDPLNYVKKTAKKFAVTPGDVARVEQRYITHERVVLSMVPAGRLDAIANPSAPYTNVTPKVEVQTSTSNTPSATPRH
jgi:zinc protease